MVWTYGRRYVQVRPVRHKKIDVMMSLLILNCLFGRNGENCLLISFIPNKEKGLTYEQILRNLYQVSITEVLHELILDIHMIQV